jgi:hypothetical protein
VLARVAEEFFETVQLPGTLAMIAAAALVRDHSAFLGKILVGSRIRLK